MTAIPEWCFQQASDLFNPPDGSPCDIESEVVSLLHQAYERGLADGVEQYERGKADGYREGIEAAAKVCSDMACNECADDIRALLQTEARGETGRGEPAKASPSRAARPSRARRGR